MAEAKKKLEEAEKKVGWLAELIQFGQNLGLVGGTLWAGAKFLRGKKDTPDGPEVGGKGIPTDEKWYGFSLLKMDKEKRRVWQNVIMPSLHRDFDNGLFGRLGHNDVTNDVRVILEAMAQETTPTIRREIRDTKTGKVKEVKFEPIPGHKPLSSECMEDYVGLYEEEKAAQLGDGKNEADASEIAINKVRFTMREAGFPIGRNAAAYNKADAFLKAIPASVFSSHSVHKFAQMVKRARISTGEWLDSQSERIEVERAMMPRWKRWLYDNL